MLFLTIFIILSVVSGLVFAVSGPETGFGILWCIPVMLGCFAALIIADILVLFVWSMFIGKNSPIKKNRPAFRFLVYETLALVYKIVGVKFTVNGADKLPEKGRFVIISNHASDLDPTFILLALGLKRPAGFIGKKDIWSWFFVPNAMRGLGCLPIDRGNDRNAAKTIITASKLLKDDKLSIGVFPEGYCEKDGKLLPFRNGVFKIAQRAAVPIVVTVLHGTDTVLKKIFRRRNEVSLDIIEVIPEETVCEMKTVDLGAYIHPKMEAALSTKIK
ncbi:MAG: lysophospholipid acyltransferase family protein [Acutalibacteraceae bacterium]